MEILTRTDGDFVELRVKGRLDAYWADHLTSRLEEVLRGGADRIRLNLAEVSYVSSIGIRVLVHFYKQLRAIHGRFVVTHPSERVRKVLETARLIELLMAQEESAAPAVEAEQARRVEFPRSVFEVFDVVAGSSLRCHLAGDPAPLASSGFRSEHSRTGRFPDSTLAVGLGAFGHDFEECRERFGEFLAVAGAVAYQPTDGSNVPDYLLADGNFVPELQILYSLTCDGAFRHLARFEAKPDTGPLALSELVEACLEIAQAEAAGIVVVGESAGLIGAALRQSPVDGRTAGGLFEYPAIRGWLSFSVERVHARALALIAGVAARSATSELAPMLRPLAGGTGPRGHFHAASFSYRPLKKGRIEMVPTVRSLFEAETLHGVLHLLGDDREAAVRQSEFVRGACWIGPISQIRTTEKEAR